MSRKPNTTCSLCGKPCYIRPSQQEKCHNNYCSRKCYGAVLFLPETVCGNSACVKIFKPKNKDQKFCSIKCSAQQCRSKHISGNSRNPSLNRLNLLKRLFGFDSCMIRGCNYTNTYDLHRLIKGCDGGKYEVGNMFAICPNHHAEVHRGIITLVKLSDCELKLVYIGENPAG